MANSHSTPDFQSSHQVYQAVSHCFNDKIEYFFKILDPSPCIKHDDLLDLML